VSFAAISLCVASQRVFVVVVVVVVVYFVINSVRKLLDTPSCNDNNARYKLHNADEKHGLILMEFCTARKESFVSCLYPVVLKWMQY
jgi:hypothetical protein